MSLEDSQKKALKIEERLKSLDPVKGEKYNNLSLKLINAMKEIKQTIKEEKIDDLANEIIC